MNTSAVNIDRGLNSPKNAISVTPSLTGTVKEKRNNGRNKRPALATIKCIRLASWVKSLQEKVKHFSRRILLTNKQMNVLNITVPIIIAHYKRCKGKLKETNR